MDLGQCWQPAVWANGSWVEGAWCPDISVPCTPVSIGLCWGSVWCSGTWVAGAWCPTTPPIPPVSSGPGAGNVRHLRHVPGLFEVEADKIRNRRKREEEEIIIL